MWQPQSFFARFVLRTPVILSGHEAVNGLWDFPCSRVAVIYGRGFGDQDLLSRLFEKKALLFIPRSGSGEPDLDSLHEMVTALEDFRPDTIIAAGGGSVLDAAKICRLLYELPSFKPGQALPEGALLHSHFIAVPTLSGSGAEVSSAAVYIDKETRNKKMLVLHELQPEVIVYDPRYPSQAGRRLLCEGALDCLAHLLEGYISTFEHPFLDNLAEAGLAELKRTMDDIKGSAEPDDKVAEPAVIALQHAGFLGGIMQNHCLVGAAHALAHQLCTCGFGHAAAVGLLLPAVIRVNCRHDETARRCAKIASLLGLADLDGLCSFMQETADLALLAPRRAQLKSLLGDLVSDPAFCAATAADPSGRLNPLPLTPEFLKDVAGNL